MVGRGLLDRIFWVWLSRIWTGWRSSLIIVQPATVVAWHRKGFPLYWRWTSRPQGVGRPRLDAEFRPLIRRTLPLDNEIELLHIRSIAHLSTTGRSARLDKLSVARLQAGKDCQMICQIAAG